jgi:hypothetical protein
MAQGAETPPNIVMDGCPLEVTENFTYLGSTISSSLTIDSEINNRIARAATVMAQLKDQAARLRTHDSALWHRYVDYLRKARKEAQ